ncbi:hypothetical protein [Streptomyces sp. N35]|uniref:hypothetical protein n=1 Tax=Streptomyces sp. N35 TaxID=2795730 RepID=UPI0018F3DE0E|nr:hypothetical protein [Streptomyces sp. N35]
MSWSSWLLCLVLAALTVHYPWLLEAPIAGATAAAQQPALLVAVAVTILGHKIHRRWA